MLKLGFSERWVSIVMNMVKSVSYSVIFNGKKLDDFKPSRGIQQRHRISPHLSVLALEGLSSLLKKDQLLHLSGILVAPSVP